jgi:hypothetical protein
MKQLSFVKQAMVKGFAPYFLLLALITILYFQLNSLMYVDDGSAVRMMMWFGLGAVAAFLVIGYFYKVVTYKHLIFAIILCGVIMRIGYMSYTPFTLRAHDLGGINDTGHYGYLYTIFQTGKLPSTNDNQFYHPPLQHLLGAALARIVYFFRPSDNMDTVFDAVKIIPCFASCAILPLCYKICGQLRLSKLATVMAVSIMAFHPTFFFLSASINNDSLMLFFFIVAILYTLKWYNTPSYKNILLLALTIGLGMMTKISVGIVALFTAPVFLAVFVQFSKAKKGKQIFRQLSAFVGVCFPLALWYPIRNLILFHQSLVYVLDLTGNKDLYCGGYSVVQRFLSFPFDKLITPTYCNPCGDFNLWLYTVKCSMFGEFTFGRPEKLAQLLIIANFLLILLSLAAMIYVMICCKKAHPLARFGLFAIWLVQIASFVKFNLKYPFGCTMDFRYIVPTVLVGAIYIGMALSHLRERGKLWSKVAADISWGEICLFAVASVLFYT